MTILDEVARTAGRHEFRPRTTEEFFALRLAVRLDGAGAAQHYADLANRYSENQLLEAYGRAVRSHFDVARRFHLELETFTEKNGHSETRGRLAAIRIDRRSVAVAILNGDHLQYTDSRQLASSPTKALETTVRFITRQVIEKFQFGSAAFEIIPNGHEKQRTLLHQAAIRALSPRAIGVLEIAKEDVLGAFGHPPLRFRNDVQEVIAEIYPVLNEEPGGPWIHDAAALGLYVQTERLFNRINQSLS